MTIKPSACSDGLMHLLQKKIIRVDIGSYT